MAMIGYHPQLDVVVMVYRGTEDVKNWVEDFSFKRVPYPRCKNCKVHAGFYAAYESVASQMRQAFESLRVVHPSAQIVVIGASLGGAIAEISAL